MIPSYYFIHPEDEWALEKMKRIPFFDTAMKKIMNIGYERFLHGVNMASNLRLSESQDPVKYSRVKKVCELLEMDCPEVYLETNPFPNAYTYGDTRTCMVLTSGLFDFLEDDEVDSVIAHECGHILCHHVLYHTMARSIVAKLSDMMKIVSAPVSWPLLWWYRRSELSADRVATLVCGEDVVARTQLRLSGGPKALADGVNIEEWVRQAEEYEDIRSGGIWDKLLQMVATLNLDHPMAAVRVRESRNWSRSENYAIARRVIEKKSEICPNCHQETETGSLFCRHCGEKLING